jgi:hypothetical protein
LAKPLSLPSAFVVAVVDAKSVPSIAKVYSVLGFRLRTLTARMLFWLPSTRIALPRMAAGSKVVVVAPGAASLAP